MEKNFDFKSVGKRTPYQVPDGFFPAMQQEVLDRISKEPIWQPQRAYLRTSKSLFGRFKGALWAAAAVIVVLLVMTFHFAVKTEQPVNQTDIEVAFDNLSTDDQDFLLAVYAEDVFLEESDGF